MFDFAISTSIVLLSYHYMRVLVNIQERPMNVMNLLCMRVK